MDKPHEITVRADKYDILSVIQKYNDKGYYVKLTTVVDDVYVFITMIKK